MGRWLNVKKNKNKEKRVRNNCTTRQSPLLNQTEQLFKKKKKEEKSRLNRYAFLR